MPIGEATASAEAGAKEGSKSQLLYEATLKGAVEPSIPENIVWYRHEPTWKSIAEGRLKFGLKNFSLNVSYEDDFGVHAGLKASAIKAGLDIGGKFEDHQSTVWRIEGTFREISEDT
ncbi:MAG: hypothetical protein F6J93_22315 [Oscillatoria sp. SIO1A7]|nr:hypothetical protein [Oscillatoria sp. SIO1A7]